MLTTIFQFYIPSAGKAFTQRNDKNVITVFDLEDGVQDILNPENTPPLKKQVRGLVKNIIENISNSDDPLIGGLRVNSFNSIEFKEDICFLKSINKKVKWLCIYLPKINSCSELDFYQTIFQENEILFEELIPCIETDTAFNSIESFFSKTRKPYFKRAVFGNHDYNLDCGHWPFQDYDSAQFWHRVKFLVNCFERNNCEYIHAPIVQLKDAQLAHLIISYLANLSSRNFSMVALSSQQAEIFSQWNRKKSVALENYFLKHDMTVAQKVDYARNSVANYKQHRHLGKSFSIKKSESRLISPQEFTAAQTFLQKHA